jgi:hypothetical protein
MTPIPQPAPAPVRRARSKLPVIVGALGATPLVLFGLYVWGALSFSYSDGERAGVLQKFSRKGWLCKTYEGELAMTTVPGVAPTIWAFSVRDPQAAAALSDAVGKKVMLHYSEHRGVPTRCFAETPYYVTGLRLLP